MTAWPFGNLQRGRYRVIYADPAWTFAVRSPKGEGRTPQSHYETLTLEQIKALPVAELAAEDCVLLLWCVDPLFNEAFEVIRSWGFTFKTIGFHWVKTNRDGSPFTGMGYWTRANPELCLLATRGSPSRLDKSVRRLLEAGEPTIRSARREHSRKPDEAYQRIERLLPGPHVELFARTERPGWDSWGNETGRFKSPIELRQDIIELLDTPELGRANVGNPTEIQLVESAALIG